MHKWMWNVHWSLNRIKLVKWKSIWNIGRFWDWENVVQLIQTVWYTLSMSSEQEKIIEQLKQENEFLKQVRPDVKFKTIWYNPGQKPKALSTEHKRKISKSMTEHKRRLSIDKINSDDQSQLIKKFSLMIYKLSTEQLSKSDLISELTIILDNLI